MLFGRSGVASIRLRLGSEHEVRASDYSHGAPTAAFAVLAGGSGAFQSGFHWHVLDPGIQHVYIKPATPRLNGKVERSHRIDAEEFYRLLEGVVIDDTQLFKDKL